MGAAVHSVLILLGDRTTVADIGCGLGSSTILMAKAYPNSRLYGFDYHEQSIELASATADREGVGDRIAFEVASAKAFPGRDYDFVVFFDSCTIWEIRWERLDMCAPP